jgi:hypothetical protein
MQERVSEYFIRVKAFKRRVKTHHEMTFPFPMYLVELIEAENENGKCKGESLNA